MSLIMKWWLLVFFIFMTPSLFSQEEALNKINNLIEQKNWTESITALQNLEKEYPKSSDIKFKLAQVYFWNNEKNKAFDKVSEIPEIETNEEILRLKIQIQQERKQYNEVIELCNFGISKYENTEFYYMQKTIAYTELNEADLALNSVSQIKITDENRATISYLKSEITRKKKNFITLGYLQTNTLHNDFPIWYLTSLEYGHKLNKHTIIGRVNYSFLSNLEALQYEIDWYPKLSKKKYALLNFGISNDVLFPNYKVSAEIFHEDKQFTVSLGGKKLFFDTYNNVTITTGHIGYTIDTYKIMYRSFYILHDHTKGTFSHYVGLRKKFDEKDTYIQLELMHGSAPYFYYTNNNFSKVSNYRIGLVSRFKITETFAFSPNIQFEREEVSPDYFRDKIHFQANITYHF
ncbi:YaiO family outer membrane beta-barrel protein [Flavobacterium sp. J27]|uniref:YaiO family outer membrane beta-barrel protein n=1 Tax=Flavobacterium sp. J27 TaxID=2060419 RepID=UPI0010313971|nr:YaiO family outer membrane beta-barrel protein [Flavobacterium sp. J27]